MREVNNQMSPLQPLRDQHLVQIPSNTYRMDNRVAIPDSELLSVKQVVKCQSELIEGVVSEVCRKVAKRSLTQIGRWDSGYLVENGKRTVGVSFKY